MRKTIILILVLLVICTISGFTAPAKSSPLYDKVLIYCNFDDMNYRKQLEAKFLKYFKINKITAAKSLELMPPLKEYTADDVDKIMKDNGLETLLEIKMLDCKVTSEDDALVGNKLFKVYVKDVSTLASAKMNLDVSIVDKRTGETAFKNNFKEEAFEDSIKEAVDELFENFAYKTVRRQFMGKKN
ncbi:MAG: hypothetical protein IJT92_01950 [Spirochaetia bacterium]|nr:hypothetical protein [Spirochaetia bacterium]MBQ7746207.1 hypothetical protein [Spirochaetia bacterium]